MTQVIEKAAFDASGPEWADLTPVYQEETETPLCPILYDPNCKSRLTRPTPAVQLRVSGRATTNSRRCFSD